MVQAIKAGLLYFTGVFCVGFILGGLRIMLLEPILGELLAVAIEVPVILVGCWILCARAIKLKEIPPRWPDRLVMGIIAFVCLFVGEVLLSIVFFGQTLTQFLASFLLAAGLLGLGGQLLFALFPLLQLPFYNRPPEPEQIEEEQHD